jgi:oxidase EvaA
MPTLFANSFGELKSFLTSVITNDSFSLTPIKVSDQSAWRLDNGAFSHVSNGFFHVCGLEHETTKAQKLMLFQPQSALTGLALYIKEGKAYVLLQARIEPGNTNIGQFGPTIQSTPANYLRMHGGKATACVDWFTQYKPGFRQLDSSMQFDLGERYFQKSKLHNYVEVDEPYVPDPSMIWASLEAIFAALQEDNFLNADLRSLLSVFDWSLYLAGNSVAEKNITQDESLFLQALITGKNSGSGGWRMIDLQSLQDWTINDYGIEDKAGRGIDLVMYKTECTTREVTSWSQPLLRAKNKGVVELLIRDTEGGETECLVTLAKESGICGSQTLLPSTLIYPGEYNAPCEPINGVSQLVSFNQSDEGGRFMQHESTYKIVQAQQVEPAPNQYWISLSLLQKVLATSNQASFQLRCIASALLPKMHSQI